MGFMSFFKLFNNLEINLFSNDYWTLLFMACLSLYAPVLFICMPCYLALRVKKKSPSLRNILRFKDKCPISEAILFIQRNHINSLTQAIESNPELLYSVYKNQSLLMWCKHYNNSKAQSVVLTMAKKYPKTHKTQLISA